MTASRREQRQAALQVLCQIDASGVPVSRAIELFRQHLGNLPEQADFAEQLVQGVHESLESIDAELESCSQHWRLERMPSVDRNILRLALFELRHVEDIPPRVTINEAVELAKRYGTEQSPRFVNGVLDEIAKTEPMTMPSEPG